jgi:hypothetical protein
MKEHVREAVIVEFVSIPRSHDGFLSVIVIKFPIPSCRTSF